MIDNMDTLIMLNDKSIKAIEKRGIIIKSLKEKNIGIKEIKGLLNEIDEKKSAIIFEAMEAVTNSDAHIADIEWQHLAVENILSVSNRIKREASRIVGNIAHKFPNDLEKAIEKLLLNSKDPGTVVRWSSAYALAKIIVIPQYANGELFDRLTEICNHEEESGVKNQYVKALKKAAKVGL
ncbi:MAG: hypothetical protein A2Y23_02190 [Clostridiales bacterium GWB2_37_7]|nr:MAG: hypothetical protein A2Y23_02190 [Clostridiales bacterium GWB2_37_7]